MKKYFKKSDMEHEILAGAETCKVKNIKMSSKSYKNRFKL